MQAAEIIQTVADAGGQLWLDGDKVRVRLPESLRPLVEEIRQRKPELVSILSRKEPRPSDMAAVELLPDEVRYWDDALLGWTQARCVFRERSYGAVGKLYEDHVAWAHRTGAPFVADVETFLAILMALGFQVDGGMVYGLIFRADANAALDNGGTRR